MYLSDEIHFNCRRIACHCWEAARWRKQGRRVYDRSFNGRLSSTAMGHKRQRPKAGRQRVFADQWKVGSISYTSRSIYALDSIFNSTSLAEKVTIYIYAVSMLLKSGSGQMHRSEDLSNCREAVSELSRPLDQVFFFFLFFFFYRWSGIFSTKSIF